MPSLNAVSTFASHTLSEDWIIRKPLVLIYDDLLKDRQAFLVKIADYCHATFDKGKIPAKPKHTSYTEKQIRFMQRVSKTIPFKTPHYSKNPIIRFC